MVSTRPYRRFLPAAARLIQKPHAPLGLIDPDLDQASCGDVVLLDTKLMRFAQARDKRLIVGLELGQHVLRDRSGARAARHCHAPVRLHRIRSKRGAFADSHFVANIEDLKAAVRATAGPIPLLLIGHSLGGAAAIAAANEIPSVRAIATLGAPFDPAHALRHFGYALAEIERNGAGEVQIGDQERERRKAMLRRSRKRPTAIGGTIVHAGVTSKL